MNAFVPYRGFNFPALVFEMINIHLLDLILWNVNMNCMRYVYEPNISLILAGEKIKGKYTSSEQVGNY